MSYLRMILTKLSTRDLLCDSLGKINDAEYKEIHESVFELLEMS